MKILSVFIYVFLFLTGCAPTKEELFKQARQRGQQAQHKADLSAALCTSFGLKEGDGDYNQCLYSLAQKAIDREESRRRQQAQDIENLNNQLHRSIDVLLDHHHYHY